MKKLLLILLPTTAVALLAVYSLKASPEESINPTNAIADKLQPIANQNIVAIPSPKVIDFAGESVPVQYFDVNESLSRELTSIVYGHGIMAHTIRLSNRYFPIIEPILKEQGAPDDLKYLCVAESNLQNVVSPAKAAGYWQFLEGTAKDFGLEVNGEVDERYHIEKSTVAACKYFKAAYAKYGTWSLAAASYNVGMGHINKQIERQKTDSYYDMALNIETGRYVYRAIAYKEIMSKPKLYGFNIPEGDCFIPFEYDEVTIKTTIANLADFAEKNGTTYKLIKMFNPWLRSDVLTNKTGKTYIIKIPKKGFRERLS